MKKIASLKTHLKFLLKVVFGVLVYVLNSVYMISELHKFVKYVESISGDVFVEMMAWTFLFIVWILFLIWEFIAAPYFTVELCNLVFQKNGDNDQKHGQEKTTPKTIE